MRIEWPTVGLLALTYTVWGVATMALPHMSLALAVVVAGLAIAMHGSLQHEVIHGHPTRNDWLNDALVFPALSLIVPYLRFKDTHLAHHIDADLTDPYDDPESNYLTADDFAALPGVVRGVLLFNNTLAGRLLIGPLVGMSRFLWTEWAQRSDPRIQLGWAIHLPAALLVLLWVWWAPMPLYAYALASYFGLSLLRIRTFLEHRAHELSRQRSVIIEDRGPFALLFLNNNFHVVHHTHPKVAWYQLPSLYDADANRYLEMNGGYRYRSYAEVFARYLFRRKDPVAHPLK